MSILYLSINTSSSYFRLIQYAQNDFDRPVRIYCLILTAPKYFDTRARAVNLTWAPRCDKFSFISEYSNDTKGLSIAPIPNIKPGYEQLNQKTTLGFQYVYENFFNDVDWFVKADDDTYLFVENLKTFLKDKNSSEPITFGHNVKVTVPLGYHSGGAAYVLSREALKRFYQAHHEPNTKCKKDGPSEDVQIAICLRKKGVYPGKSVDENNRERFHFLSFANNFHGRFEWFLKFAENTPLAGRDCCSNTTISFHYVTPNEHYLIDTVRYGLANK